MGVPIPILSAAEPLPRPYTKIVATLGPATDERIPELIEAGMSVARINFSHGTAAEHGRRVELVRSAAAELDTPVGILADLPGPKMRLGRFEGGSLETRRGELLRIRQGDGTAPLGEVYFNFEGFLGALEPGHRMVLADGLSVLRVEGREGDTILARVVRGGLLGDGKGVHLPDSDLPYTLPTERDREWIEVARELGVDFLGLSFVARPQEIEEIRALAREVQMVAKIERRLAVDNLEALLAVSDGLMVARGDLGVELELEQVPMLQKALLHSARRAGRFTITATEMLESMTHSSRPTRAEVADVANAVLDGTDAVMLSGETAVGRHPVEAVRTMARIVSAVEHSQRYLDLPELAVPPGEADTPSAIARAAARVAAELSVSSVVCFTESGRTVRLLSRSRPAARIIALSPNDRTVREMTILSHVRPYLFGRGGSLEEMLRRASDLLLERQIASQGERIVFVAGVPPGVSRSTNVMKIHRVGAELRLN